MNLDLSMTISQDAVETTTRQQYPCQDKDNEYDGKY